MADMVELICDNCGKEFKRRKSRVNRKDTTGERYFCSKKCVVHPYKGKRLPKSWLENRPSTPYGKDNPNWKGGRYKDDDGYIRVNVGNDPHATTNGWALEHRVIMSKKIGRPLRGDEHVHHIDGDKENNSPDNLKIMGLAEHTRLHFGNPNNRQIGEPNPIIKCACGCGGELEKYDKRGRPRSFLHGHN